MNVTFDCLNFLQMELAEGTFLIHPNYCITQFL